MPDIEIFARLLLALSFGAILGLETETRTSEETNSPKRKTRINGKVADLMREKLGGVRTYTVLSLFGAISGMLFHLGYTVFAYLMFIAVFLFVLSAYILNVQYRRAFGMTTELAILITVLVGFAATAGLFPIHMLIVIVILLTFTLSQKRGIGSFVKKIAHQEITDVITYGIVAIVILPFLPNLDITIAEWEGLANFLSALGISNNFFSEIVLFNPFKLWQYVVLISGFNLLGYFASKRYGRIKGQLLTGIFGGLVSSTATTIALAHSSKSHTSKRSQYALGGAALIGNAVSFIELAVLSVSASAQFFISSLPATIGMALSSAVMGILGLSGEKKKEESVDVKMEPFSITPAVKFVILLMLVRLVIQMVDICCGSTAFVIVTALSGVLGMDMATIAIGELVGKGSIDMGLGVFTYVLTNGVNFVAKAAFARTEGARTFFSLVWKGLLLSFVVGFAGYLIMLLGM